jgi:hypothetical protein
MKKTAVLLDTPKPARTYHIHITTNTGDECRMHFTNKVMAQQEYNRIKGAGIYCGQWAKTVDFTETINEVAQ